MKNKMRIAVIGGRDPSEILEIIIDAIAKHQLNAIITAVISPLIHSSLIKTAERFQITTELVSLPAPSKSHGYYDKPLSDVTEKYHPDLIILIGYTRILSTLFIKNHPGKILNVHGSLLPKYRGLIGEETQKAVLAAGDKQTGCTVHWVTDEVDAGPILVQKTCDVDVNDTPKTLRQKLIPLAGEAYVSAIKLIQDSRN